MSARLRCRLRDTALRCPYLSISDVCFYLDPQGVASSSPQSDATITDRLPPNDQSSSNPSMPVVAFETRGARLRAAATYKAVHEISVGTAAENTASFTGVPCECSEELLVCFSAAVKTLLAPHVHHCWPGGPLAAKHKPPHCRKVFIMHRALLHTSGDCHRKQQLPSHSRVRQVQGIRGVGKCVEPSISFRDAECSAKRKWIALET